jgi:hypothetical protein
MTGAIAALASYGATPPATLVYYLDASAQGAFPGASITTSASFNGSSQYLTLPASTNWAFGTGDFTIEWWQYQTGAGIFPRVFSVGSNPSASVAVSIESDTFYFWETGSYRFSSALTGYLNTWTHFAISRVSGQTSVYKNGTQLGSTYADTYNINDSSSVLAIGQESVVSADNTYFPGRISNFRIIKGTGLYSGASLTVPTSTLRAVTGTVALLPLTAAPFMDISTNLATVTNVGSVTTIASAPSLTAATTDVTGNYALTYGNTSGRITWASTQGGIFSNAFSGDGINAYITGGPNWSTVRSYTVFMGYKLTGTSNYGRLLNSNTGSPDWLMGGYASKSKAFYANGTTINLSGPVDTTWHLDWARFNKTTSKGDLFSVTSVQPTSTPAYTTTNAGIGAFNQLKLFSKSDGNECAAGDIAFVRIWDGAMTTAQMQAEWTAFRARVGY